MSAAPPSGEHASTQVMFVTRALEKISKEAKKHKQVVQVRFHLLSCSFCCCFLPENLCIAVTALSLLRDGDGSPCYCGFCKRAGLMARVWQGFFFFFFFFFFPPPRTCLLLCPPSHLFFFVCLSLTRAVPGMQGSAVRD